jgi:hypothetical protein
MLLAAGGHSRLSAGASPAPGPDSAHAPPGAQQRAAWPRLQRCGSQAAAGRAQARAQAATAPRADDARKVVLAFEGLDVGRRMLAWAAHFVLFPDDEVFVVICSKARARAAARTTRGARDVRAARGRGTCASSGSGLHVL